MNWTEGSGRIWLRDGVIHYRSTTFGDWDLPLASVRIIGESTNESGPFFDDYFFCFATGPEMWFQASFYARGRDAFLEELSRTLGCKISAGLCHSTGFASRVIWPASLAEQPMFQFNNQPTKSLIGRLFRLSSVMQTYSESVSRLLAK